MKNIQQNPLVALNLNSDESGGSVLVLNGEAHSDAAAMPAEALDAYLEKYQQSIKDIGMTAESLIASYSVSIFITPTRIRIAD